MKQSYQTILLIDHVPEAIDCIIGTCDRASLPPVKISTAFSLSYANELLTENDFSLLIIGISDQVGLEQLEDTLQLHHPKPAIIILPSRQEQLIVDALRLGAADIFFQDTLAEEAGSFLKSLNRFLHQAGLIEKNFEYKDELEKSLSELKDDQQAARQVQQNMLPDTQLQLGALDAHYMILPSLYLSGDFVDVIQIDSERTLFYLADVSGHGASSALVTVLLKNMTNRLLRNFKRGSSFDILTPKDTLHRINSELLETRLGKHLSIFLGLYNHKDSILTYALGGHHPMPVLSKGGQVSFLEGRGMPVGLFQEPVFEQRELLLQSEFELTLFSDGILEMLPEESMQDKEAHLLEAVSKTKGEGPEAIKECLLPGIMGDIPDDIAIMTISRR